jgi:hypothetical protein
LDKNISKIKVFSAFAQIRLIMRELEFDLEVNDWTSTELDVLSICIHLASTRKSFSASDIVAHPMLKKSARATVYRAISSLESRCFLLLDRNGTKQYSLDLDAN